MTKRQLRKVRAQKEAEAKRAQMREAWSKGRFGRDNPPKNHSHDRNRPHP